MPLAGFEPTIPASERPQTHALEGSATGIGAKINNNNNNNNNNNSSSMHILPELIMNVSLIAS
jgi:hypothetical protein